MKKIFVTIMTLAATIFQMQAIEDASVSILLESDNNRSSVVTLNQAAIYTANEQNASEMLAQITNTTTAVNIYAVAPYGNMAIYGTNDIIGTYVGFTTNSRTNYSLTFGEVSGSQLYLIDHGVNPIQVVAIENDVVYPFTAAASSTINNRFEIARSFAVTLNAYGWASFSSTMDLALADPAAATIYKGTYVAADELLQLNEVADIPAGNGVILYGAPNADVELVPAITTADMSGNNLKPASAWENHTGTIFVLSGEALYQYTGANFPANKAYLEIPVSAGAPRRISFRFNGTTALENAELNEAKAVKFVENGQVFIRRGNEVFNLQGQIVK